MKISMKWAICAFGFVASFTWAMFFSVAYAADSYIRVPIGFYDTIEVPINWKVELDANLMEIEKKSRKAISERKDDKVLFYAIHTNADNIKIANITITSIANTKVDQQHIAHLTDEQVKAWGRGVKNSIYASAKHMDGNIKKWGGVSRIYSNNLDMLVSQYVIDYGGILGPWKHYLFTVFRGKDSYNVNIGFRWADLQAMESVISYMGKSLRGDALGK